MICLIRQARAATCAKEMQEIQGQGAIDSDLAAEAVKNAQGHRAELAIVSSDLAAAESRAAAFKAPHL